MFFFIFHSVPYSVLFYFSIFYSVLVKEDNLSFHELELGAENWKPHEKLKYILPKEEEGVSGFSIVGRTSNI